MRIKCTKTNIYEFTVGREYETTDTMRYYGYPVLDDTDKPNSLPWGMGVDLTIKTGSGQIVAEFELVEGLQ